MFALGCSRTEIHLIPKGFRGDVVILPGYQDGVPPKREGFAMVFEVPPSGILITQDEMSSRWHRARYYYVDAAGKRELIDREPSSINDTVANRADQQPIAALFTGAGEMRGQELPCPIYFTSYYVGSRAHLLSRPADEADHQELLVRQLVQAKHLCR